jgi:hypothetical protein
MKRGCDAKNREDFSLSMIYFNNAKSIRSTPLLESNLRRWYINSFLNFGIYKNEFKDAIVEEYKYNSGDANIKKLYEKYINDKNLF